jgi:AhpC/TSA family protein
MGATILYQEQPPYDSAATAEGPDLWMPSGELHAATGWELRPEGACRGDVCVPIPRGRESEFLRERPARFNLAALARLLGQPVVHEDAHGVWSFGESADARSEAMRSLRAPDFTLPDLEGRLHSLTDYRGKKVFLVFWASW